MAGKTRDELTAERLRSLLDYEPSTGILRWRANPENPKKWNSRHAGKPAGCLGPRGYVQVRIGHLYQAHRLIWMHVYGRWPMEHIDHINGDPSDNRLHNLREATRSENLRNRPIQKNNQSGFKGVRFRPHHGKWEARIAVNRIIVWRGYFWTAQEAASARRDALERFHGKFAHPA